MPETPVPGSAVLTPEIVKKISDEVYKYLLADLRRERERTRRKQPSYWKKIRP